ncbi:MAG: HlyC/CorC family transporter [Anaerolinea sp.]|nr:HlyC/CorC family transporter [Anaerolinea sp.]
MNEYLVPLLIITGLILLNGLFVAAEFAIVAAPRTRLTQAAERGSRAAADVLSILADPAQQNRYLATAQIGVTIASLGLGMYGEHTVAAWLHGPLSRITPLAGPLSHTVATILAIGILTYLHVVLGEMIPKSLAIQHAESAVLRLDRPMVILRKLFQPVVFVLNGIGNQIVRLMGIPPVNAQARLFSAEELEYLMEESAEVGLVEADEQLFIENIFDLRDRSVGQVMTRRKQVVGLSIRADEQETLRFVCQQRHSRYPVYGKGLDDIIGVLHVKTLARQQANRDRQPFDLRQLARPAAYVPESLPLDQALTRLRRDRRQLAIVVDEYGGTAGLVTLEDIIEEVVGEILDEFDLEIAPLERLGDGLVRARGDLLVDELNQLCDLSLKHPEADTVGGLVMAALGRLAEQGDHVTMDGVTFEVEGVEGLAVQTVLVRLPAADKA